MDDPARRNYPQGLAVIRVAASPTPEVVVGGWGLSAGPGSHFDILQLAFCAWQIPHCRRSYSNKPGIERGEDGVDSGVKGNVKIESSGEAVDVEAAR